MATLSLKNIYKTYPGGVAAVQDFSLAVEDREFIIFVGPSGCGKSTTLRMIAGLEDATDGEITIDGVCVNRMAPKDRDIAMVFQNYALYPHMTVYDNMAFGLKLRGYSKKAIEQKVLEAAEILEIKPLLKRKPKALSGGQRQRVAMGRAIVREPKVFLMDEPLSNLDAKLRVQMRAEIAKLHQRLKATMIYVTHDQVEAMTLGTRIVVMKDGVIQQVGTPRELYQHPINMFVAGFIGLPQMNFMHTTVRIESDKVGIRMSDKWLWLSHLQDPINNTPNESLKEAIIAQGYFADALANEATLQNGTAVVVGFRPEDLSITNALDADFVMTVTVTEMLGADLNIIGSVGNNEITVIVRASEDIRVGDTLYLKLNQLAVHLFDPVTTWRIVL
ncbi:sn-glycerol-3-phosphate ABC transporter ATP-binding protein UgpC [Fusibacter paucivorans]|uniref:Sn-glycerol-3-phosphate ABC transporter ATP-binding protein UgpC n=1 Tax=Fusibacter paucivorans TaxID=76009 RepID=A0ABS5PJN1_9FIRM|nr:sn-glycerol-3-phosphate ABC transporter ATP-binding protein UgpC [Fusibacter paucivorans]MBS7525345.1 sn-glycerol-3-phosphate ABC transporter ATP-binding protein UgpC [Fusibacter paucivorans]